MNQTPEYLYSELPAIELFTKLGFDYFDASTLDIRESISEVILEDRLRSSLLKINPWLESNSLERVVRKIKNIQATTLMEANQIVFDLEIFSVYKHMSPNHTKPHNLFLHHLKSF